MFKKAENRDAQKNKSNWAVWVGDTINFSSKLSDSATGNMILVAENILSDFLSPPELSQYLISSCGCHAGNNVKLWQERNDLRENFGMKIFEFKNKWCEVHRQVYWDNVSIIINK